LPVDDVTQRPTVAIGAEIVAEHINTTVAVLVAAVRDMRRDQHPAIGPQLRHRQPLEFADIDIERRAAEVIALQRVEKGILTH
jgi:hypothetical protein